MTAALQDEFTGLRSGGVALEHGPDCLGRLRDAGPLLGDTQGLRDRLRDDGYLFLPGYLDRAEVMAARAEVTRRLMENGFLEPGTDPMQAVPAIPGAAAGRRRGFMPDLLAAGNQALARVLYQGPMIALFERLFGEPVRHYDFTWFRSVFPGPGTAVHADVVFMGRGERERLFSAWTPVGDIDTTQGGLIVLEGSNRAGALPRAYAEMDVDAYCSDDVEMKDEWARGTKGWLSQDPVEVRRRIGRRWLTAPYRAGDVVIFSVFTVHASLDNRSDRVRLSADSRYQPASARADDRWIGANPAGHGPGGKRAMIC